MYSNEIKNKLIGEYDKEIIYDVLNVDFLSERDRNILSEIGLPDSISPYITIASDQKYGGHSLYDRVNIFEKCSKDESYLKDLCFIGNVDYGYIVIDKNGTIQILNHENEERIYVNASLDVFLESAFAYQQFICEVNEKYGEDGFFEGLYSEEDIENLKQKMNLLDERAVTDGFWNEQIEFLYEDMSDAN